MLAQSAKLEPNAPTEYATGDTRWSSRHDEELVTVLEEITVIGKAPPSTLLRMGYRVQGRLYDMFNELNTEDEFDMVCKKEARIGSQIKYQRCRPRFYKTARAEATLDALDAGMWDVNRAHMRRLEKRQRELMIELANQNPQFLALLLERRALMKAYQAALDQRGM